jgi:CubicO group peptidase (beta-lactamase class C family)
MDDWMKMVIKKNIFIWILVATIGLCSMSAVGAIHELPLENDFTKYAEQARVLRQTPGMAIAIIQDGKIIYARGFGVRNAKGEPATPDTIFNIGSITKSFTAALLAMQIEEGKYSWRTKIKQFYPEFKLYDPEATQGFEVRDIIAHDSGLPEDAGNLEGFGYSVDQVIYALRFIKPVAPFRTQFAYQDVLLTLAQKIIENNSEASYSANLRAKIFAPLGMKNSYAETEDLTKMTNVSQRYFYANGKIAVYPKSYPYIYTDWGRAAGVASGGIDSSANDLAKWLIFQMNNGLVDGKQLISVNNMKFMHSPLTLIANDSNEGVIGDAYGEGWFYCTHEYKPYTMLFHSGNNAGASALVKYIPAKKIGIVILSNKWDPELTKAIADKFFALYFSKPFTDEIKSIASESNDSVFIHCAVTKGNDLTKYVGTYSNEAFGKVTVSQANNNLVLTIGSKNIQWQLTPCQPNIFKAYWPSGNKELVMIPENEALVRFTIGKVNKMQIDYLNTDGTGVFQKLKQ